MAGPQRCGRCRQVGHRANGCKLVKLEVRDDDSVLREILLTPEVAAPLIERIRDFWYLSGTSNSIMLSCYLQGVLDGQRPEVARALNQYAEPLEDA